ncbi:MAG: phosphoglycerate dehydrogenase [Isosphaeraceae bacterium]
MPTILIAPGPLRGQPGPFREILAAAGFHSAGDFPGDHTLSETELRAALPESDAMLAGGEHITATLLDLAPKLRVVARTGVGFDAVDVAACTARRVAVVITPGTNQESVAEQTFGLLLALTRDVVNNDRLVKAGGWNRNLVRPIRGQTMGLVGMGRIGKAVATRAIAFGMRVIAHDPLGDSDFDGRHGVTRVGIDELLSLSDVVSLHLPLSPATAQLIRAETLARMKPSAILINTSRGGLVNEPDLYEALTSGRLAGAGLDVLGAEPPEPSNPLLTLSNVVVSPHVGGIDTRSMADMAELAAGCVVALKEGRWPEGCVVNEELREGWSW